MGNTDTPAGTAALVGRVAAGRFRPAPRAAIGHPRDLPPDLRFGLLRSPITPGPCPRSRQNWADPISDLPISDMPREERGAA